MKLPTQTPRISQRAFTLVEILTAVAITTIIVFTLVKMFDTSTKALQVANRQTDIWESARATFGVLRQNIGEVVAGESLERISLFSANAAVEPVGGVDFRRQDIFVLSREGSKWQVSVYLLGNDRESDPASVGVKTLYRYQTNYPVYPFAGGAVLGIDHPILDTRHPFTHALDALDRHLDDLANLREPDPSISVMARGILHLRLVPYASDGRAFTNRNLLPVPPPLPVDHFVDADTMRLDRKSVV